MLLNDLEAMAFAIPVLLESELHVLQRGEPRAPPNKRELQRVCFMPVHIKENR
jgi:glucokinase